MQVFTSTAAVPADFGPSAVAIGKFDGVHAGHRSVIAALRSVAAARGLVATAVTFDRHPLSLLQPEKCPEPLLSNAQKLEKLAETGLDATLMLTFDRALSDQSPEHFVQTVLVDTLHASVVMVGSDFRFGHRGVGTVELLTTLGAQLGQQHGFEVQLIDDVVAELASVGEGGRRASSTWIRELLSVGDVASAARLLGELPTVRGVVVHGQHRGRELGYPTANLSPDLEGFIPADGVYAAWITIEGTRYGSAASIGNNPTFEGVPARQVEAHVLDETLDLYGLTVEIEFVDYVRPMAKFTDVADLIMQIGLDEVRVREILAEAQAQAQAQA